MHACMLPAGLFICLWNLLDFIHYSCLARDVARGPVRPFEEEGFPEANAQAIPYPVWGGGFGKMSFLSVIPCSCTPTSSSSTLLSSERRYSRDVVRLFTRTKKRGHALRRGKHFCWEVDIPLQYYKWLQTSEGAFSTPPCGSLLKHAHCELYFFPSKTYSQSLNRTLAQT